MMIYFQNQKKYLWHHMINPQTGISLYPLRKTAYLKRLCFVFKELYIQKCFPQCYLHHGKLHVIILWDIYKQALFRCSEDIVTICHHNRHERTNVCKSDWWGSCHPKLVCSPSQQWWSGIMAATLLWYISINWTHKQKWWPTCFINPTRSEHWSDWQTSCFCTGRWRFFPLWR